MSFRSYLVCSLIAIAISGCSGKKETAVPSGEDQAPAKLVADVQSQTLLTGSAARVVAGPVGMPQDEASLAANGIQPWGPVKAVHTVTIGTQVWTVNELASPDPFTHTYQLQTGTIVVSNEPLDRIVTFNGVEPDPPVVPWISDAGDQWEVVSGRIQVYFTPLATEQEIASLIASQHLHVVMSWFEPREEAGEQGLAPGGGSHMTSSLGGNEIAWFDFEFAPEQYGTVDDALEYFLNLPNVESALPSIQDYSQQCYPAPNDPLYTVSGDVPYYRESRWIDAFQITAPNSGVNLTQYAGVQQYVAVMDDGVYRAHPDLSGAISNLGVEAYDRSYYVGTGLGNPDYPVTKPGMERYGYWHRLVGHGTQIASLIAGRTNNGIGTPSLAPTATILPLRMKQTTKYYGLPGVPYEPMFSANSHVKSVRALRFELYHGAYNFYVRVVNMSFGYPSFIRNVPWPYNFPTGDFKTNLTRDLKLNDRLYVGSAGNDDREARVYPASYEGVLGVSGVDYNHATGTFSYTHRPETQNSRANSSNYMPDETYPVSGVYMIFGYAKDLTAVTPPLQGYEHEFYHATYPYWDERWYRGFGGTSAAAPQVSALAYHLFSKKAAQGILLTDPPLRNAVRSKIIGSRGSDIGPVNGIVNYQNAFAGW